MIASCKHIYHIFCAAAVAKNDNRCTRCDAVFHPHWWQNFGFRKAYSGLEDETLRLELPAKLEELRQSLQANGSLNVQNCKCFPSVMVAYCTALLLVSYALVIAFHKHMKQ